jgi:glycosyltransferase involved in cell wall biosynthesis
LPSKKNIVVLTDWYLPAYKAGGPVKSVAALVYHLKNDYNFFVITSDKDAFDKNPLNVKTNEWLTGDNNEKIIYLPGKVTRAKLLEIMAGIEFDCLYINSFFSKPFSIYPLILQKQGKIKQPIVLAPRGMLRKGALSIKYKKKKIFLVLSKLGGLHENLTWHATSQQEVDEIKKIFGKDAPVVLVANLTLPPLQKRIEYTKKSGELKICCVARLVKNKKIDFALEVLKNIKEGQIIFDVFGPPEDEVYYKQCLALAQTLPSNISVSFKGNVLSGEVEQIMKQYHVFLLPTLTENFGHAIIESMLNGCIPVISNQTPWQNLQKNGLGWDIALNNKQSFISAIKECLLLNEESFKSQSIKIQLFAEKKTSDLTILKAYQQLFK